MGLIKFASMARISLLFTFFVLIQADPESNGTADGSDISVDAPTRGNEDPEIRSFHAKFVMVNKIYAEWEIDKHAADIKGYKILYIEKGTEAAPSSIPYSIRPELSNDILDASELKKGVGHRIGIRAVFGSDKRIDKFDEEWHTPLEEDIVLTPRIYEIDNNSINITWDSPPNDLDHYYYYEVNQTQGVNRTNPQVYSNTTRISSTISSLKPEIDYQFRMRFCIKNTKECGDWSAEVVRDSRSDPNAGGHTSASSSTNVFTHMNPLNIVNLVATIMLSLYYSTN